MAGEPRVRQIGPQELKALLDAGQPVLLLDVRQPWEHELARLEGSQLVPLPDLLERAREVQPPPGTLVVAYCHHGVRSLDAAYLLGRLGHDVVSLAGGIDHWSSLIDPSIPRY